MFLGSILTCGEYLQCIDGRQNLCEQHLLYGYDPYPGAYTELAAVPPIAVRNLIPTPPDLPSGWPPWSTRSPAPSTGSKSWTSTSATPC